MDAEPTPSRRSFDLSGDALCLDFANSWGDRRRPESDRLRSYDDLLAFARQTGAVTAGAADALRQAAAGDEAAAAIAHGRALELRDALYRLLAARARGREPEAADLALLNEALRDALPHLRLAPHGEGYGWSWDESGVDLLAPLRPIVRSAADLLAGEDLARVRECDGATCTWLFFDRSRNRSRRWCSMDSCGNRAKAARHYHRRREQGSG